MELNEIKKILYKDKPDAEFLSLSNGTLVYWCHASPNLTITLYFHIPISDLGNSVWCSTMPSQQLIRWLVIPE